MLWTYGWGTVTIFHSKSMSTNEVEKKIILDFIEDRICYIIPYHLLMGYGCISLVYDVIYIIY